jgi:hypothetical protein
MTKIGKNRKENEWKKEPASPTPGAMISIHAYLLLLARKTCQLLPPSITPPSLLQVRSTTNDVTSSVIFHFIAICYL